MTDVRWDRFPLVAQSASAKRWLTIQANLGLASNTIEAYGRALEGYLRCCGRAGVAPEVATREHVALYVRELAAGGLANATLQQRLTAVRLYYDDLVVAGLRPDQPVGRGRYTPGNGFGGARERGLIPRYHTLPWIPTDAQWRAVLEAARAEPVRNRLMLALAYDAALRREELCALQTGDVDPAFRLVRLRAETTKTRRGRTVPYSPATGELLARYLEQRRALTHARGPLFLSASRRNRAQPLSIWTWSKVVEQIAARADVPAFTTHTLRHLCLTDLARAGWGLHEIAQFAGHRNLQTTMLYVHLGGRDLAAKIAQGMAAIHEWRLTQLQEVWDGALDR